MSSSEQIDVDPDRANRIEIMARGFAFVQQAGLDMGTAELRFHVTPVDGQWEVDTEAGSGDVQVFTSKRRAVDAARQRAHAARGLLITHRESGAVQAIYSYLSDAED